MRAVLGLVGTGLKTIPQHWEWAEGRKAREALATTTVICHPWTLIWQTANQPFLRARVGLETVGWQNLGVGLALFKACPQKKLVSALLMTSSAKRPGQTLGMREEDMPLKPQAACV